MTKEDVIRMALEAGGVIYEVDYCFEIQNLERFAALISTAEREVCANVCENFNADHQDCNHYDKAMAEAIRARG